MKFLAVIVLVTALSAPISCRRLEHDYIVDRTAVDHTSDLEDSPDHRTASDHIHSDHLADRTADHIAGDHTNSVDHRTADDTVLNHRTASDHIHSDDHAADRAAEHNADRTSGNDNLLVADFRTGSDHMDLADHTADRTDNHHTSSSGHQRTASHQTSAAHNVAASRTGFPDHDHEAFTKSEVQRTHIASEESATRHGHSKSNIATSVQITNVSPNNLDSDLFPFGHKIISEKDRIPQKNRRKIKVENDGTLWTKFPNMKRLVEIVPIKHKSKSKALAYIVPKSHSVKKKLKKQKVVSGIVIDRNIPDLNMVFESTEEEFMDSSESKSSEDESKSSEDESKSSEDESKSSENESTSSENESKNESEYSKSNSYDDDDTSVAYQSHESETNITPNKLVLFHHDKTENEINNKLNDIVAYFKDHKDNNFGDLVHDIIPDESDPEYHVHYIKHKNRQSSHEHNTNVNTEHGVKNVIKLNYDPISHEAQHKKINGHHEYHHNQKINTEYSDDSHSQELLKDDDLAQIIIHSHHDTNHHSHGITPHNIENYKHIVADSDKDISISTLENIHNLIHEGKLKPLLHPEYKSTENENEINEEIIDDKTHILHVYEGSNESRYFGIQFEDINQSDVISKENSDDEQTIDVSNISEDSSESTAYSDTQSTSVQEVDDHDVFESQDIDHFVDDKIDSGLESENEDLDISVDSTSNDESLAENDSEDISPVVHDFIFQKNCLQFKKKNLQKKCRGDCGENKSYTLTFLFNR